MILVVDAIVYRLVRMNYETISRDFRDQPYSFGLARLTIASCEKLKIARGFNPAVGRALRASDMYIFV